MKIAFFGTGDFSRNILLGILEHKEIDVSLVVSQPDKPIGRKKIITPTPVKILAEENNIHVEQPAKLRNNIEFFKKLEAEDLDFIVVVAYGKIVPNEVLDAPKHGCINIHGSILPAYRGASPIQEAVKNGDSETGLTIMYMSEGMDEGDILKIEKVNIETTDTTEDIFNKFENIGANLLINTLNGVLSGQVTGKKQDNSQATYCSKITKEDGEIDFNKSAQSIYDMGRAYSTWPGIYTYYNNKKLNIVGTSLLGTLMENNDDLIETNLATYNGHHHGTVIKLANKQIGIVCNPGILIIKKLKLEGKKSMDINSFINGNKEFLDYKF